MESDDGARAQLRALERAEAAPYVDYPPTPRWYVPAAALWGGAMASLAQLALGADEHSPWIVVGTLALTALVGGYLSWYQRYHGAMPSMRGNKPVEIRGVYRAYAVGAVVALAVNGLAIAIAPWWVCAVVGFVTMGGGLWWYERAYARAAAAAKERLA